MVATFVFSESNTSGETVTDNISNINFGDTDAANITVASFPIRAGNNSYRKYIRGKFSGTFNQISAMKFWRSDGQALPTGIDIKAGANPSYATPVTTASGDSTVPTTEGTSLSITPSTITVAGYSSYIRLQMQTTTSASPGDTITFTFRFQYDEQ